MPTNALLIVPPLLKHVAGPLLGPAMLAAAAGRAGHCVHVLDINNAWLRDNAPLVYAPTARTFVGDHDRPSALLRLAQAKFAEMVTKAVGVVPGLDALHCDHESLYAAARDLLASPFGDWLQDELRASRQPDVFGVSLMYAGQVLPSLVASLLARELWPRCLVVWGGAHVTALREGITTETRFGKHVDRFVFGYAERTWVELLDAISAGAALPIAAVVAGSGVREQAADDTSVVPRFDIDAIEYARLTLPAQASRGCAYAKCAFCTYPAIEGTYRPLCMSPVSAVVEHAARLGAAVSFKDSLVVPKRLQELADIIAGRVEWSACTKLHVALDAALLRALRNSGLRTLEIGLETLADEAQRLVGKKQPQRLLIQLLDAAQSAGVAVVVNYITGFPGIDAMEEERWKRHVERELQRRPTLVAKLELNHFELERLSPMGARPADYGITLEAEWPWSSLLNWRSPDRAVA